MKLTRRRTGRVNFETTRCVWYRPTDRNRSCSFAGDAAVPAMLFQLPVTVGQRVTFRANI